MKRYIWMAVLLVGTVGAHAEGNPFELNDNFKKVEKDQDALLKELRRASAKLEALQEAEDDADIDAEEDEEESAPHRPAAVIAPEKSMASQEHNIIEKEPDHAPVDQLKTPVREKKTKEIVRIEKVKVSQTKIDAARAAQMQKRAQAEKKAKQEKAALAKLEKERKASRKRMAEKASMEKVQKDAKQVQIKTEKTKREAAKVERKIKGSQKFIPARENPAQKKESQNNTVDINITKEKMEAAKRAEEELRKAIEEVDQED